MILATAMTEEDQNRNAYQTPEKVCDYMVSLIPDKARTILEPTPGKGNLVKSLKRSGRYSVTAAVDFFALKKSWYDCIVMNPPFSSKYAFNVPQDACVHGMRLGYYILEKCLEQSDHVIALMPWFTLLDSDVRLRTLKSYGIKSLTALPRKTFSYARIQTVILELEKGYEDNTIFKTLKL
jgi:hypothetical protein